MQNPNNSAEQLVANCLCRDLNDPVQELQQEWKDQREFWQQQPIVATNPLPDAKKAVKNHSLTEET